MATYVGNLKTLVEEMFGHFWPFLSHFDRSNHLLSGVVDLAGYENWSYVVISDRIPHLIPYRFGAIDNRRSVDGMLIDVWDDMYIQDYISDEGQRRIQAHLDPWMNNGEAATLAVVIRPEVIAQIVALRSQFGPITTTKLLRIAYIYYDDQKRSMEAESALAQIERVLRSGGLGAAPTDTYPIREIRTWADLKRLIDSLMHEEMLSVNAIDTRREFIIYALGEVLDTPETLSWTYPQHAREHPDSLHGAREYLKSQVAVQLADGTVAIDTVLHFGPDDSRMEAMCEDRAEDLFTGSGAEGYLSGGLKAQMKAVRDTFPVIADNDNYTDILVSAIWHNDAEALRKIDRAVKASGLGAAPLEWRPSEKAWERSMKFAVGASTKRTTVKIVDLPIRELRELPRRAQIPSLVEAFEAGRTEDIAPPVLTTDLRGSYVIEDGNHRLYAAKEAGITRVPALVVVEEVLNAAPGDDEGLVQEHVEAAIAHIERFFNRAALTLNGKAVTAQSPYSFDNVQTSTIRLRLEQPSRKDILVARDEGALELLRLYTWLSRQFELGLSDETMRADVGLRFHADAERFPIGIFLGDGRVMEIANYGSREFIIGRLDKHFPELNEWNNELHWDNETLIDVDGVYLSAQENFASEAIITGSDDPALQLGVDIHRVARNINQEIGPRQRRTMNSHTVQWSIRERVAHTLRWPRVWAMPSFHPPVPEGFGT